MNKKWEICSQDKNKVQEIAKKYNISELVSSIIINRGMVNENEVRIFLDPKRSDFYDPFLLPDMKTAVDRIISAIKNNEKMIIYGDYDVDGITSIAVLKQFLEERGISVGYHIPNRLEEGYGLNKDAIKQIAEDGYTLMITVDCGISAIEEVKYANMLRNGNNSYRSSRAFR